MPTASARVAAPILDMMALTWSFTQSTVMPELLGDVLVRETTGDGHENLLLAVRQHGDRRIVEEHLLDFGDDDALSGGDLPDDFGEVGRVGNLPAGSEYDSLRYVSRLVESAKSEILIIDPYSDATTLDVLAKKHPGVTVRLVCKDRGQPTSTEIAKFNHQNQGLT